VGVENDVDTGIGVGVEDEVGAAVDAEVGAGLDFGVGAGGWAGNETDTELETRVDVGAGVKAEEHTGLETGVGVRARVLVLERELELVRGPELVLARGRIVIRGGRG
jgi:hypothetical protein